MGSVQSIGSLRMRERTRRPYNHSARIPPWPRPARSLFNWHAQTLGESRLDTNARRGRDWTFWGCFVDASLWRLVALDEDT